jgi:predicted PurR-regulated permease PerM
VSRHAFRLLFWLGVIVAAFIVLVLLRSILMPFIVSFIIAYLLVPAVAQLEHWGVRRSLAALIVLIAFLLVVVSLMLMLVPLIQDQVMLLISRVPDLTSATKNQFDNLVSLLQQHLPAAEMDKLRDYIATMLGEAVTWLGTVLQSMITSSIAILNVLSLVIVTPIVTFFLLRDWNRMVAMIDSYLPREGVGTVREQMTVIGDTLGGFVRGQGLVCLILAAYYATALSFAGLQSAVAVGLLIGILAIIPIAGATIGFALSVGLAAVQFGTWTSIFIICGIFVFGQSVEANVLTPKLVGDRVHLHPVWVIFALFAGGALFGFIGVVIAVPAAAVIGVLVRFALLRYRRSSLYDPHRPGLTPFE